MPGGEAKMKNTIRRVARRIAIWLAPELEVDQRRYQKITKRLYQVYETCSYNFPSTGEVVRWVLREEELPTIQELQDWLNQENSGVETVEIVEKVTATLNDIQEKR